MAITELAAPLLGFIDNNPSTFTFIASLISLIVGSGILSFLRRPKQVSQGEAIYFVDEKLLAPPMSRPGYSDRMAYVLAEMSSLAYYEFEGTGGTVLNAAQKFLKLTNADTEQVQRLLGTFADELLLKGVDSREFLEKILLQSNFKLLGTVNVDTTQAFVCRRVAAGESPYVVVAFRGTEKKIDDWLTDADAIPTPYGNGKVHTGFLSAFTVSMDAKGKTAEQRIEEILADPEAMDEQGQPLPLFFTGHSLGGALALLATRELADDSSGACYTYGAPRIADYEYFGGMKTPVFRVVNSADIVPRVPPGAIMSLIVKLVQGLAWITGFIPVASQLFKKLEALLDKLNGYRHFGDQRYLTDVKSGRFHTVKLLSNPPAIDRIYWMGQQIRLSFLTPVKSHGMEIYRKKLNHIANSRMKGS
ncbi:lipase family protein [Halieaceae bacterium IMCC14734]|uniref:Lipase family protein n=1 Tax=Candidatus Litorirhabdus singularis TaxID=2518993 RepID=A0ABT3TBU3_9GAMM|nr:lipase family protein [Candidatus Litorirhabdus singularis]MCX2979736.1 lipase family protein [Candidatus Litorirhabdus singularis]